MKNPHPKNKIYDISDVEKALKADWSIWSYLLFFFPTKKLTLFLANKTNISPNQITIAAFTISLFSAFCFFQGEGLYLIIGAVLFETFYLFDCIDGVLARLKNKTSPLGSFLDASLDDMSHFLNIFALTYGQFRITKEASFLVLGMCIIFIYLMIFLFGLMKKNASVGGQKLTTKARAPEFFNKLKLFKDYCKKKKIYPFFTFAEADALIFFIGPVLGIIKESLWICLFFYSLMFILYFVVYTIDLLRLSSNNTR